jgi:abequosyltransferase
MNIKLSICIPAYNRAKFLPDLLDSIVKQNFNDYEVIILEDNSPEKFEILKIAYEYLNKYPNIKFRIYTNDINLGYDGNIRKLAEIANGKFCFFLGNDDLLAENALINVSTVLDINPDVTYILRSYGWFYDDPTRLDQIVRYFSSDRCLTGKEAFVTGYRRAGVISGFIIKTSSAKRKPTSVYDGYLYYQMYMALNALDEGSLYYLDKVITYSRATEKPDFGNSVSESSIYTPGIYTPQARLKMLTGALLILSDYCKNNNHKELVKPIINDYSKFIYPYIKDQLSLPFLSFVSFYISLCRIGFYRFPIFHVNVFLAYFLGEMKYDFFVNLYRKIRFEKPTSIV